MEKVLVKAAGITHVQPLSKVYICYHITINLKKSFETDTGIIIIIIIIQMQNHAVQNKRSICNKLYKGSNVIQPTDF
jgi:hypothetical protein